MSKITLLDGTVVEANPKINAYLLHTLKTKEGFKTSLVLNSMVRDETIDELVLVDAVFISYRNANPNGMKYEEFLKQYELDVEEAAPLLMAILSKKGRSQFAKEFIKKTQKKPRRKTHSHQSKSKK